MRRDFHQNPDLKQGEHELAKFKAVCRPVVEYIQAHYDPHTKIVIGWADAILISEEMGAGFKPLD